MQVFPFTRAFLLMLSCPLIWAAHFFVIYVVTALACARRFAHIEWMGVGVVPWSIAVATLAALAAIAAICREGMRGDFAQDSTDFARWSTVALGALSAVAIVWEAIPAFIVPACM